MTDEEDPKHPEPNLHLRNEGLHYVAGRGAGKSRYLGRFLAFADYVNEIPTIVFDNGDTIDNFMDRYQRGLHDRAFAKEHLLHRGAASVLYVDVVGSHGWGGANTIVPFPLYYRLGNESTFAVSQRFLEVIKRVDPDLQSASVQGYNPLWQIATMAGRILITLNMQITEMGHLITHTDDWKDRFTQAVALDPSVSDAVEFFTLQFPKWPEMWKASLFRKLTLFTADDTMKAIFGASAPGINWQEIIDYPKIVLFDFRNVHNEELSRFLMQWIFFSLRDFILYRGTKQEEPISIIIDELSAMMNVSMDKGVSLEGDFDRMLNTIMRRHNIYLTIAHQAMNQFSEGMQALLLGMGNQMIGRIDNMDDALQIAKAFFPVDPTRLKFYELPWRKVSTGNTYTIPEQHYERAYNLTKLEKFHYIYRPAQSPDLYNGRTDLTEPGVFVTPERLKELRDIEYFLMLLGSEHRADVLKKIAERLPKTSAKSEGKQATVGNQKGKQKRKTGEKIEIQGKPPLVL